VSPRGRLGRRASSPTRAAPDASQGRCLGGSCGSAMTQTARDVWPNVSGRRQRSQVEDRRRRACDWCQTRPIHQGIGFPVTPGCLVFGLTTKLIRPDQNIDAHAVFSFVALQLPCSGPMNHSRSTPMPLPVSAAVFEPLPVSLSGPVSPLSPPLTTLRSARQTARQTAADSSPSHRKPATP